jgi:hypothetical protein
VNEQAETAKSDESPSPATEVAALPVVDAPALSPEPVAVAPADSAVKAANETAPSTPAEPGGASPTADAPTADAPNATQRFRAAAALQISAARERLADRNKSPIIAAALIAGLAGAAGQAGISSLNQNDRTVWQSRAIEDAIARLDDSIAALRNKVEHTAELSSAQSAATVERLEKIEKAQSEPTAQIIRLADVIEKLRANAATVASRTAAPDATNDVTGSIKSVPSTSKSSKSAIVEGWTLLEIDRDAALLEGKRGLFETSIGDTIPGVGRVEAFRKQDGRWVVVTARGLIVSR